MPGRSYPVLERPGSQQDQRQITIAGKQFYLADDGGLQDDRQPEQGKGDNISHEDGIKDWFRAAGVKYPQDGNL